MYTVSIHTFLTHFLLFLYKWRSLNFVSVRALLFILHLFAYRNTIKRNNVRYMKNKKVQQKKVSDDWRSKDKLISNVLLWLPTRGHASSVCSLEGLSRAVDDRDWL